MHDMTIYLMVIVGKNHSPLRSTKDMLPVNKSLTIKILDSLVSVGVS